MRKLMLYCLLAALCLLPGKGPRAADSSPALEIGDSFPTYATRQVFNLPGGVFDSEAYAGKLLILDFFHTQCGSCITKLALFDSLQHQFGQQLQIVLITTESRKKVAAFWAKSRFVTKNRLPVLYEDTLLQQRFPHQSISHIAWVDGSRRVIGITSAYYVTAKYISQALQGAPLRWSVKRDREAPDWRQPLLQQQPASQLLGYSALLPYQEGLPAKTGVHRDSANGTVRTFIVNYPLLQLYLGAFGKLLHFPPNRISWQLGNRHHYVYDKGQGPYDDWLREHAFCYESVMPLHSSTIERMQAMIADLNRFTGLRVRQEMQDRDCWWIVNKPETGANILLPLTPVGVEAVPPGNFTIDMLLYELNKEPGNFPVLDSSHRKGYFPLDLPRQQWSDIKAVAKAIAPYGFQILPGTGRVETLVFAEQ